MVALAIEKEKTLKNPEVIDRIHETEDLLFHLADQVTSTDKDKWNVIIGDDMGGRLPAHFIHDILKQDGRDIKTFFVASSKVYRQEKGSQPYQEYFQFISEQLGEPMRPLIVTESVGTGNGIEFVKAELTPFCETPPEVATVAVSEQSKDKVEYAGGVGEEAIEKVWHAYESPPVISLGKRAIQKAWRTMIPESMRHKMRSKTSVRLVPPSINETVGIMSDLESDRPIAAVAPQRDRMLSHAAFSLMNEFADEYQQRNSFSR